MPHASATPHADRARASSFGNDALLYDRARPSYPEELIDLLVRYQPETALDVGCGTGIAPRLLLERGCKVVGVEPDDRMAAVAASHGVEVEVSSFEAWPSRGRQFELLVSAQAWHWVDPIAGAAKAAEVLVGGALFACFWNVGQPDARQQSAVRACYQQFAPGVEDYSVLNGHESSERFILAAQALEAEGRFDEIETTTFPHRIAYTTTEWLDHLDTHSNHQMLAPPVKADLFAAIGSVVDSFGGTFELAYHAVCVSARRIER